MIENKGNLEESDPTMIYNYTFLSLDEIPQDLTEYGVHAPISKLDLLGYQDEVMPSDEETLQRLRKSVSEVEIGMAKGKKKKKEDDAAKKIKENEKPVEETERKEIPHENEENKKEEKMPENGS